jgi:serine/threonine-protein kinase
MDRDEASAVQGSDGAYAPVLFAPTVKSLCAREAVRAPVTGGAPFQIASVDQVTDRGAAWASDGFIYIGGETGISRVPLSGGTREILTTVDRARNGTLRQSIEVLPGNRGIVFTILRGGLDDSRVGLLDLRTKKARVLLDQPGYAARYVAAGHLVFLRAGALMAVPFDLSRLDVVGTPQPVLNDVAFNNGSAGHFAVSDTGVLVYLPGRQSVRATIVWADRSGRMEPVGLPADTFSDPALSPDGRRLA